MAIKTADQLLQAGDIGRCELLRGELRMMNAAGGAHGRIVGTLTCILGNHIRANGLGTFFGAETGFILGRDPDTVRAPDFAFVRPSRPATPERGFYPGAPDLAVEVLSPDDGPRYVREKIAEWLEAGTLAVWVVDPRQRTITIHGRELFPGFELPVDELFE